jgi:hypothetical protein
MNSPAIVGVTIDDVTAMAIDSIPNLPIQTATRQFVLSRFFVQHPADFLCH